MTPEQFRQVEDLFHRGKDLPPEEQRALLDAECGDDAEVRAEVEKLLAQADPEETLAALKGKVNQVLRPGAADSSAAADGPVIEGYDILREIHRGGQGVVYQAIQKSTKRKVAIKVLLEGPYASKSARRRFEREIELVAQLKHPNIIGIFHSGQTSDGRQYCVMDYVRGVPLDQYVRNEKLTLEDALKLFATVCEAVNYAHQKGVIHRDLKPSNILVTPPLTKGGPGGIGGGSSASQSAAAVGDPKVLDFGLAKQLISREASLISLTGQVVGTLPYMSPEQAEGNPDKIDIRTDVYALGVILYQMLTGRYPYPVAGKMAEVLKHIAETEPTPPTRSWKSGSGVTQRAHKRIRPGQCPIDDEVQTIVLRTLAKERERRYQSASELAKDVGHYLADEPLDAKRDSAFYVIRKQLRRYKLPVAVAAAFVVVIIWSLVVSVALWRQAERSRVTAVAMAEQKQRRVREEAEQASHAAKQAHLDEDDQRRIAQARSIQTIAAWKQADELKTVTEFQQSMLGDIDAYVMGRAIIDDLRKRIRERLEVGKTSPERIEEALASFDELAGKINATDVAQTVIDEQVLSRAVKTIEQDFADQPLVRAALQQTVADTYREIGHYEQAMPLQEAALETRRTELGNDHPDTLVSIGDMGVLIKSMGKYAEAAPYYREALEGRRRVLGDDHPDTLQSINNMGVLLRSMGKLEEARGYYRESLEGRRRVLGDDHPDTLISIGNMGSLLKSMGKYDEALSYYREALEGKRRVLGDDHPDTLISIGNMGGLLKSMGKLTEAEPYLRETLAAFRRMEGDDHPNTLGSIYNMGGLLQSMGKYAEAMPYFREVLESCRRVLGDDHPNTLKSIADMGGLLKSIGKLAEAEPYYREALEGNRRVLGDDHPDTLVSRAGMGGLLKSMGKLAEAEPYYRETLAAFRRILGDDHPNTVISISNMGNLLKSMGKLAEAEPYYRDSLEGHRRVLGDDHPNTLNSISNTGSLLVSMGKPAEAEPYFREALEGKRRVLGDDHPDTLTSIAWMGSLLQSMGKLTEAEPYYREALEGNRRVLGDDHPDTLQSIINMGTLLQSMGKLTESEPYFREALEGRRRVLGDDHLSTLSSINNMAYLLQAQGKFAEAEPLFAEAVDGARRSLPQGHWKTALYVANHGKCLAELKRYDEAETALLKAYGILETVHGSEHKRTIKVINLLASLYEAWHAAEPAAGHDARAAEWRAKLPTATSQPATNQPTTTRPTSQPTSRPR